VAHFTTAIPQASDAVSFRQNATSQKAEFVAMIGVKFGKEFFPGIIWKTACQYFGEYFPGDIG